MRYLIALFLGLSLAAITIRPTSQMASPKATWWQFQAIDTMKYSRDVAGEMLDKPEFDQVIEKQTQNIAATGATHIAIATPYDERFFPFLKRWVQSARKNNLKVWFRGNWSGWEEWFDEPSISRDQHIKKTEEFILKHRGIFEDGDIFSACPECENGGPGDPRSNEGVEGHRRFLIDEYKVTKQAFKEISKAVASNYLSMNGDVANLIMDRDTTEKLDGIVVIDHYVKSPERLVNDIRDLAKKSGGKIILGEFGAPIPDIHGSMDQDKQDEWLKRTLLAIYMLPELTGLSYWTNVGGSTQLWQGDDVPRKAVSTLTSFYQPKILSGRVVDETNTGIKDAVITSSEGRTVISNSSGYFYLPYIDESKHVNISAPNYLQSNTNINTLTKSHSQVLVRLNKNNFYKIKLFFYKLLRLQLR